MTSNVRSPRDDEEELKAQIAIHRGQSKSLKDVLTDLLNEEPSEDFVDAVENNILLAQEREESIDLNKIIQSIKTLQSCWV
ncbi:MAG: hypothetical protein MKZ54_03370 [Candidatus Poseidoniaceae archaeon]|nr:hypothetical protein [Candidatus Poseidoniaceae archaeon]